MNVVHFPSAAEFRCWLEKNHATAKETWLGFHKKSTGSAGLTYPEAVDEALCFGWIDGIVRRIDDRTYTHRFTPRRPGSIWSLVNVRHAQRLIRAGKMHAAGLKAFGDRRECQTGLYSYEQEKRAPRPDTFPAALASLFRQQKEAWTFWQEQPPGYRRTVIYWVTSAKLEATRQRRLREVIAVSAAARRLGTK